MNSLMTILVPAGLLLVALLVVGFAFSRMYQRASREVALVKTGTGGRKVVIDGGTLVVPVLHEITKINMRTTRLEVRREGQSALITADRMRVDVAAEFYVTVDNNEEGVAAAAKSLGARTFDERALREMIEGKLVDALRAVAAKMDLDSLHENRSDFVQQVQTTVAEDLKKNGLSLESVSLTALDQTPLEGLDENNVFNALGLQEQAERIATSRKKRAEIEAEADVAVASAKQQAQVKTYEIERTQEQARVDQRKAMDELAAQERSAKAAADAKSQEAAERARITQTQAVEIAEQERKIAVSQKSRDESKARAEADAARAEAVKAEESVATEREIAIGERNKRLAIITAEQQAETEATSIRVQARAGREAAEDDAAAIREKANAEADQIKILADAVRARDLAEAEGLQAKITAENALSSEVIDFRLMDARIAMLPKLAAELVRPAEKIGNISINSIGGLGGGAGGALAPANGANADLVASAFNHIQQMAVAMPALRAIGAEIGVNVGDGLEGMLTSAATGKPNGAADADGAAGNGAGGDTDRSLAAE